MMTTNNLTATLNQAHDPAYYMERGNEAGKVGKIQESLNWYMQGLTLAKKIKDSESIKKLSGLIALSL